MRVDPHTIHFSSEEIFQVLHDQDLKLWEQVVDLLADTADELYSLTPVYGGKRGESVIGNGIEFDEAGVFWSNKDLLPPTKWEEVFGQK